VFAKSTCQKRFPKFSGASQRFKLKEILQKVIEQIKPSKSFTKESTKNPKPIFSRLFLITLFGRYSVGVQIHDKNIEDKSDQPG
jgi:hypothetical protein